VGDRHSRRNGLLLLTGVLLFCTGPVIADVSDGTMNVAGTAVHYKLILPKDYNPEKAYPAVLAFPGGPQTMEAVERTVERIWRKEAERRGYIVVIPAAPEGRLFFEAGDRVFPGFLTGLLRKFKILGNKFYIAGVSNGGISAFHIAASYPRYFWSVTGFPGYLRDATPLRVRALSKMCVNMYVGERDTDWLDYMSDQASEFLGLGLNVQFQVEAGQGHRLQTLEGDRAARLFDQFEQARHGCGK
jgi:poly(3-hydroxybutyrate) depolymerase